VRGLREEPGRAAAWQRNLDGAAGKHGLSLLWCMATPADFCESVKLANVAAIRSSGDYRYKIGSASLWCWFLYGNALARSLGLVTFKDVFLSRRDGTGVDGDPHAEVEALLSAMSAGPVAIGDRVGRSDRELILRTCREDGVLVRPDAPLAALSRCFRAHAHVHPEVLLAETFSRHPAGTWQYLVALHAWRGSDPLDYCVRFEELGSVRPSARVLAYDWKAGRVSGPLAPDAELSGRLAMRDFQLWVLCPVLGESLAIVGDPERYASAGDGRVSRIRTAEGGVALELHGVPGERARLRVWTAGRRPSAQQWGGASGEEALGCGVEPVASDASLWDVRLTIPARGWASLWLGC
jgi:hypothetical protein